MQASPRCPRCGTPCPDSSRDACLSDRLGVLMSRAKPRGIAALAFSGALVGAAGLLECQNPLFYTHWAGKIDIQTLSPYPAVRTNLKNCPAYNHHPSCCHQTFESEQQKYFDLWVTKFQDLVLRVAAHRESVIAAGQRLAVAPGIEQQQFDAAVAAYDDVLSPAVQAPCFSKLITYVAGMICFGCRPDWALYAVVEKGFRSGERVVRVRMERKVCDEMWAACREYGLRVASLYSLLRDSSAARRASLAQPDLSMFLAEQLLCDWIHDTVALHPFQLPLREDPDVPSESMVPPPSSSAAGNATAPSRRLGAWQALDVLLDGQNSGFDLTWHPVSSTAARVAVTLGGPLANAALLAAISACSALRRAPCLM